MSNEKWLKQKYDDFICTPEEKQRRVVAVSEIMFDKIIASGIETFDQFDLARGILPLKTIKKLDRLYNDWIKTKIDNYCSDDYSNYPMGVQLILIYSLVIERIRLKNKIFKALDSLAWIANILEDGRLETVRTYSNEYAKIVSRIDGYEIVWNMFEAAS